MAPFQRQVQGVVLLIFLFSRPYLIESQTYRDFPKLFNAAQFKPISTTPSGSTCGIPTRSAYCKSSVYESSLSRCFQDLCEQDCPRRTSLPSYSNLLLASNFGDCVHRDTVNVRPGNSSEDFSSVFNNGPRCYLTPLQTSELDTEDGVNMFTLAVWIWQETGNEGTIYQKVGDNSKTILQVRVSSSNIHIYYSTSSGFYHLKSLDSIPAETWTHLGIQVYGTALSVFLNGLGVGFAASDTYTLAGQIHNGTATEVRVGQAVNGSDQFLGRLQDFRFYPVTLTNREIEEVSSGVLPSVHLQTACRCPPSHPRVKPFRSRFCIKNGVPDNTINQVLRLNNYSHPLEFLNDGDGNSIWVSSFLDDVTITIDLQDEFQVFYVVLQFYSPLPTTVTIERKRAGSPVWERWQLYASDCNAVFGLDNNGPLPSPTSVNCLQFGSSSLPLPLSKGNVTFNLLAPEPVPRPGHNDFYNTPDLYQFVKASQVRVRLQGHFNVTQSRHRYYGLQEYIVTARCQCHGHAEDCDTSTSPYRCNCLLDSHTEGNKCERCQPLYNDKAFTVGDQLNPYNCKPCQCYNHASSCVYNRTLDPYPDEHNRGGGGMCINCQHNTRGQHCDRCILEFYRPLGKSLFDVDVCSPCGCYAGGVLNGNMDCEKEGGQCYCKDYVGGRQCSECKAGYFNLQPSSDVGCEACDCHTDGTVGGSISCHATTGQCNCKANVRNLKCDACNFGFFNLTSTNPDGCSPCNCDPLGSNDQYCDPTTGQCRCKDNVVGKQCDRCSDGYYDFEGGCKPCGCDVQGTVPNTMCDKVTGQCVCKANVEGRSCDQCKEGFFDFGRDVSVGCSSCDCNLAGTLNSSSLCDKASGNCECKSNVQGRTCNQCRGNTWNLNLTNPDGCESCDCDVTGTQEGNEKPPNELTCDQNSGQCTCLSQRRGRRCEECESGWYINNVPGGGCLNCDCHRQGAITGTVCNSVTGQCQCKAQGSGVTGRRCDTCQDKYYNFDPGRGECEPCRCNPAGSLNDTCHAMTGQCECKEFVTSLKCDQCKPDSSVLEAENPYGCSKTPQQQPPPTYMVLNATSLRIMWGPPDYPNGVILTYFLFRDGQQAAALDPNVTQVLEYNDTGLVPFTDYAYYVQAVNRHGLVQSPEAVFRTPEGPPQGRFDLMVSNVLVNTADMRWTRPTDPNGLVLLFTLTSVTPSNPDVPLVHFNKTEEFETQLTDLIPYTNYTFTITACNLGGCLSAAPVWAVTRQAAPTGQGSPNVTAISSTAFYVEWKPPALANGIIIFYELWMQGILQPDGSRNPPLSRIFHPAGQYNPRPTVTPQENALVPPSTNFTVTGLEPYTEYEFLVLSQNDIGKASSPWVVARTLEAVPLSMPPPVISPVSSSQLNITWTSPEERQARGIIVQYRIYERKVTNLTQNPFAPPYYQELVHTAPGTSEFFLHGGLAPYSYHEYMVEACNSVGCVNSTSVREKTLAAPPRGQGKPSVIGYNMSTMEVKWSPPQEFNGPAPHYLVERTSTAFSYPPLRVEYGTRFPGGGYYKFPPETLKQGVGFTGVDLWFKTSNLHGLLMFAASEGQQEEFIALQLRNGRPWFLFDPQGCVAYLSPNETIDGNRTYTDGEWHHMIVRRRGLSGSIVIDGMFAGSKTSECATGNIIGSNTGLYIGGLPREFQIKRPERDWRARVMRDSFQGCVRDIKILHQEYPEEIWQPVDWADATENVDALHSWEGCPVELEAPPAIQKSDTTHFLGRGYIAFPMDASASLESTIKRGNDFDIRFQLRTELKTSLLFFAYGGLETYFYVQMIDGSLFAEFSTPVARGYVLYPHHLVNLCDGQWKEIFVLKKGQKLLIQVDRGNERTSGNDKITAYLNLVSPLYIGGIPMNSEAEQFVKDNNIAMVKEGFGGCMKNFRIKGFLKLDVLTKSTSILNVNMDGCPPYVPSLAPCQASSSVFVYNGTGNITYNSGLNIFTDYLYRVYAVNDAGNTSSSWTIGKTKEGPPNGMSPPYNVRAHSGFVIGAQWSHPTGNTGLLTKYMLRGYDWRNLSMAPRETEFLNTSITYGNLTTAIPFTPYKLVLVACTAGGCAESAGVNITTPEEAPLAVSATTALSAGPTWITVGWSPPLSPNGIITGYILLKDGQEAHRGNGLKFNVTGLQVYTSYVFLVQACTRVGCTDGPESVLVTAQLPPTATDPPTLTVLGTRRIRVEWREPSQLNGAMERYVLLVSVQADETGVEMYNSTDLYTYYTLEGLVPGTTYHIRVIACTGGGCTTSPPSTARTEESAPEGVPDPVVVSPSPTELRITWGVPLYPNGIVLRYDLYHNGLKVSPPPTNRSYYVSNLRPWSLNTFRVAACTAKGCGSSNEISARTQEAPPEGRVVLDLRVEGARTVMIKWTAPAQLNGNVSYTAYFEGYFYQDPENWNYNLVTENRGLYTSGESDTWVTIDSLVPYSQYRVTVRAANTKGSILSNEMVANMPQGSPDGVAPPTLTSPSSTSIRATWRPVGRANTDTQPVFQLQFRETTTGALVQDLFAQPTTATTYLKTTLTPYTRYEFRLVASNTVGSTQTEWVSLFTRQDKPGAIDPPMTTNVKSRSIDVTWEHPLQRNGIITQYRIYQNDQFRESVPGNVTQIVATGLIPYTDYVYKVEACTVAGCTMSPESQSVRTLIAAPEGVPAPTLISETPTSVLISWGPPTFPNGDLTGYTIERRLRNTSAITLVALIGTANPRRYVDQAAVLTPYTEYEYRILASTVVGTGYGPWAVVTTRSSRPSPLNPPVVDILGPTSVRVNWKAPTNPNGILEYYIIKFPIPRIELRNTSILSLEVDDLLPYTEYTVTVTACTDGGCSESQPRVIRTEATYPAGQQPPVALPISQTLISVTWQAPPNPNGPNIRYELARLKLRQPLDDQAIGFNVWNSIYTGSNTNFDDPGLTVFTTYVYRVTVYNDFGPMISDNSEEVTTSGGVPQAPANLTAVPVSHVQVGLSWNTPDEVTLQGFVDRYEVIISSPALNTTKTYDSDTQQTVIDSLSPNTRYQFLLRLYINGGASIDSRPVYATTLDGAPEGLPPPQLYVVSDTALRVTWTAPAKPNGQITGYYIYINGQRVDPAMTTAGSYVLQNLQPYTIYDIKIQVCTVFDCLMSDTTQGTTAEAIAQNVLPPTLDVIDSYSIGINWTVPSRPNGIIVRYEIMRKAMLPCDLIQQPMTTAVPSSEKCSYIECGILEGVCGSQCFSGPKTCCGGVLHDNRLGYECCGTDYIPGRQSADDICCAGKFYPRQDHFQCCGGRYVEVRPDQICCPDPTEDRVDVGFGDQCCGSIPYDSSGAQLCCTGTLYDKYGKQCCGRQLIESDVTCCGDSEEGIAYTTNVQNTCCGTEYVPTATTACCVDEEGKAKSHTYDSATEKTNSNEKCCGTERISSGLSCCNNVGFNPISQVCADRSSMESGCGSSTVCQSTQSLSAFCDSCQFNSSTSICGSVSGPLAPTTPTSPPTLQPTTCEDGPHRIYSGLGLSYTDAGLYPYITYEYSVVVVNRAGSQASDYASATTMQAKPEQVAPPTYKIVPSQLDTIYLSWKEPGKPNGAITAYILLRSGVEIYRGLGMQYMDNNNIKPYQTYTYLMRACSLAGCTNSEPVTVATLQAAPEQVLPPTVTVLNSSAIHLAWTPPGKPNGIITSYQIWQEGAGNIHTVSSGELEHTVKGLLPYTEYEFYLKVCTQEACTSSSTVAARTAEAAPQGMPPPRFVILSATEVEIHWEMPANPNGIITQFRLIRNPVGAIFSGANTTRMYINRGLTPGTSYSYVVQVVSKAGSVFSEARDVTIPSITPAGIPPPKNATALSDSQIYVAWDPPAQPNGMIDQYKVLLNGGSQNEMETGVGLDFSATFAYLEPFTLYNVRIRACIRNIENSCGTGPGVNVRTFEAPPQGQLPPGLVANGASVVTVAWDPPASPNGIITEYRIHRREFGTTVELLINVLNNATFTFRNAGPDLKPFTVYEYKVTVANSKGTAVSPWASVRTLEAAPQNLAAPVLSTNSAYSLQVSWSPPVKPNGVITRYKIEYRAVPLDPTVTTPVLHVTVNGDITQTSFSGLEPYSQYAVRVVANNSVGGIVSTWQMATTMESSPSDVGNFTVEKVPNGRSVILRWEEPGKPNGRITGYSIYEYGEYVNAIYTGLTRYFEFRRLSPYTEYAVHLEACTSVGCARSPAQHFFTAEIAPSDQAPPTMGGANATHVRLLWKPPVNANGRIQKYEVIRRTVGVITKRAVSDPLVVYSTNKSADSYEYVDSGLRPYTQYEYKIRATNSKGSVESSWLTVSTDQSSPEGLAPPTVEYVSGSADRLQIRWTTPSTANGIIQSYQLQRNGSTPWSFSADDTKEYVDSNLNAFTTYSYTITACTAGGCTTSQPTYTRTRETAPLFVNPPSVRTVSSTSLELAWVTPQITNGEILSYQLKMDGVVIYSGIQLRHVAENLVSYREYRFVITACTGGGCTDSASVVGRPSEDVPRIMRAPTLNVLSSNAIEIRWQEPDQPNGVITAYELRRDSKLVYSGPSTSYSDYGLLPGVEYAYVVTAINNQGSVSSPEVKATTYSSSPEGLLPPVLTPESSSEIQATWQAPAQPNGNIYNYTLYKDDEVVYSGTQFSFKVTGLQYWTTYSFRIQSCTNSGCATSTASRARTLEGPPLGQNPPTMLPLADGSGKHVGVRAEWLPPSRPNGVITMYALYRRTVTRDEAGRSSYGAPVLLYNGTALLYEDRDLSALLAYTEYQYMVTAFNSADRVSSMWQTVTTFEAPPEGVPPPRVQDVTATSVRVEILKPSKPNALVNSLSYNVIVDDTVVTRSTFLVQEVTGLQPYTTYAIRVEACTSAGCTTSNATYVRTLQAPPTGLAPPIVSSITNRSCVVTWAPPTYPNGILVRFELSYHLSCPPPYQPFNTSGLCQAQGPYTIYSGLELQYTVPNLQPYTNYEFQVNAFNELPGGVANPGWTRMTTLAGVPEYSTPPRLSKQGTTVVVDWSDSFQLNGELLTYTLLADDRKTYTGFETSAAVERQTKEQIIQFKVRCTTKMGVAETPVIVFDPSSADNVAPSTTTGTVAPSVAPQIQLPFYQEVWFIAVIALVALLLLMTGIACCLRYSGTRTPYVRERMPLQPRQKKYGNQIGYCVDPYDGSIITNDIPQRSPSQTGSVRGRAQKYMLDDHEEGFVNPAYSTASMRSRSNSFVDVSFDKTSKSSKYLDDDDDPMWDGHVHDSGLVSMAGQFDDDDYASSHPVSVTKEQTVFTDTHL